MEARTRFGLSLGLALLGCGDGDKSSDGCSDKEPCPAGQHCLAGACVSGDDADAGGGDAGGVCTAMGERCSIKGEEADPCCEGSMCSIEMCTGSIPPSCMGTCKPK
ncbi:MAG: hypothetical protein MUF54_21880 [Polyangiaceae bacterium]|jgi:hypothetical protein|nr:hypothetical protein [Polyangiaceae bacterium]